MPLSAGTRLGPYEILAPIGAGGMGEVYRARDPRLNRDVAIKVSAAQFSERFAREAQAIAALNHPNICQIYDVGPNYLVMECVEGAPLKGPLPLEKTTEYAGQILDALDAAHRKGITHRDLKPANILLTKQGIKLLDFGLAKLRTSPLKETDATLTQALTKPLTRDGQILGTLQYMSPEQLQGKEADARSDLFSFGCVLYEMLTGKCAFEGQSAASVIAAILEREPAPLNLPPPLERVIRTCLAKDPDQRFQNARDLKRTLLWAMEPQPDGIVVGRGRRRWWLAAAAALVLGAGAFFTARSSRAPTAGDALSFAIYPPEKTAFSAALNTTVSVPQFALAPDGRSIVFTAEAAGARPMLWVRSMEQVSARTLPGTEDAQDPFWSPDGRWVGFFAEGKLKKIPAGGGSVQVVSQTATDFRGGTWGPDNTIVFASGTGPVYHVASAGGPATPATFSAQNTYRYPQFLPDGRHFLHVVLGPEQGGVYAGSLDDKSAKLLVRTNTSAVYAPPGYLLFVDGDTLLGQAFDAERLEVSGQPFLIAEHVGHTSAFQSAISASRTGIIAYAGTIAQNGRLTWFGRSGNALGLAGPEGDYTDFRLSPNEKSLAASLVDPKAGTVDVWMTDLVRGSNTRVTHEGQLGASAIWSPDGAHLALRAIRNGVIVFYQKSAGGGGDEQAVLSAETQRAVQIQSNNLINTDWSPDGRLMLFSAPAVASGNDLWLLPLTGDRKPKKYLATPAEEMHGNFSPDGHLVAYTSNESGRVQVDVQTFPLSDKKWQVSTNGGYEPRWRADGREIYYLSEDRKMMAVSVGPGPSFDVPQTLFQTRVPAGVTANRQHYVPSRDGQRFLVNTQTGDPSPTPITVVLNWTAGLKK
jgi:Tol biopolymer transport system component/tRNA A-37 threonylcarbamoyl transferase component Bud32